MQKQVIQAIRNFDTQRLHELLDDNKSYMDVTKTRFIKALEKTLQSVKNDNCNAFDDVFFGICQHCSLGCEGITFYLNGGYFLDLIVESKDGKAVDDIYVCNKLANFTDLEKSFSLGFQFYNDEHVNFRPSKEYLIIRDQYRLLKTEFGNIKNGISLDELTNWYEHYKYLMHNISNLDVFASFDYKLYGEASSLVNELDKMILIKKKTKQATEALINFQNVNSERKKLIWFFENRKEKYSVWTFKPSKSPKIVTFKSDKRNLNIDISGYESVLDYFRKVDKVFEEFMDKYKPLPEHYEQSEDGDVDCSLEGYLKLHNKHLDIVERFKSES